MATSPKGILLEGASRLAKTLPPRFRFALRGEGPGSGGPYARGEFIKDDRRLELHFRYSLGLVRYHAGGASVGHEVYMRTLGVLDQCQYPGYSSDPLDGFEHLAHDLSLAADFLTGDASALKRAAEEERAAEAERAQDLMAAGDRADVEKLRVAFHAGRFPEVLTRAGRLRYPDRLTPAERRMIDIAKRRAGT